MLLWWHTSHGIPHGAWVDGWWGSRAIWSASRTRIVLASTPTKANTRVSDRVTLHLVDGHLRSVALNELDETAPFTGWDLDIGDLAEALEERAQLVLSDVAGKTSNEDSGVVGVRELVHGLLLLAIERHWWSAHLLIHLTRATGAAGASGAAGTARHTSRHTARHATRHATTHGSRTALVFWCSSRDTHWSVTAINTLHFAQSTLLILLVGEADEAVATGHAGKRVGHDFCGLARWESALEQRNQNVLVDFRAEITNEDAEFRATVITAAISETTAGCPVELEWSVGVWHWCATESKCFCSSLRRRKIDEAVTSIASDISSVTK